MSEYAIRLLKDLIAIDSVNPSLVSDAAGEEQIANAVEAELHKIGLDVVKQQAAPGRPNVIGVLEGKSPGQSLMLCGHLDTVGVAGMEQPFEPVERHGLIYGRGSQDMKGGVASMISVAQSLMESGGLKSGRLIVAAVADEEYASIGASTMVKEWKADAAVVLEPSDLQIGIAHKGFSWVEVIARGKSAHGSRPKDGRDAILRIGRFLTELEALNRKLQSLPAHPLLGNPSLHASLIHGGKELSTYPDICVLQFERRTISGESKDQALNEAREILDNLRNRDPEFDAEARLLFTQPPYEISPENSLPRLIAEQLGKISRYAEPTGMTFWTDAAILGQAGIPSVVFGPGGEGLHGLVEYVRADEVLICRDVLVEVAKKFCAAN